MPFRGQALAFAAELAQGMNQLGPGLAGLDQCVDETALRRDVGIGETRP